MSVSTLKWLSMTKTYVLQGKTAMPGMKRDCGGAAGILGAFHAAVGQGFKQNLHAIFCLAENAVGPLATRPDDIHTLYSGRTVEVQTLNYLAALPRVRAMH